MGKYKNEFVKIDDEHKAYFLGFMYADGNISLKQNHTRLELQNSDRYILERFQKRFTWFHLYEEQKRNHSILYSGIIKVKNDLIKQGCLPQKSTKNKEQITVPNIDKKLLPHFIRGYYDGDGGCTLTYNSKKVQKRLYIYSNNNSLLKKIKFILKKEGITSYINISKRNLSQLTISTNSYKQFYNYLYENCNICLFRKRKLLKEIIENTNFFVHTKTPKCINCQSNKTVKHGFYKHKNIKKQIYLCRNCGKTYKTNTAPGDRNIISGEDELLED